MKLFSLILPFHFDNCFDIFNWVFHSSTTKASGPHTIEAELRCSTQMATLLVFLVDFFVPHYIQKLQLHKVLSFYRISYSTF